MTAMMHIERHRSHRAGWLRAGVLGANDGIVSTAALVLGVAAADTSRSVILTAGMAGLVAGALSMAVGEYVSVSSQRDTEQADIAKERHELATTPERELAELTTIYRHKGLSAPLARQVAEELSEGDVLKVHLAEELGITDQTMARPIQAMLVSGLSFASGAAIPLIAMAAATDSTRLWVTIVVALIALLGLGSLGARLGGAPRGRAALRVFIGGAAAMGLTMLVGNLFGTAIG
jgi:VIT1/CCC1 family predicted Fe2+/Mn2+ transporter